MLAPRVQLPSIVESQAIATDWTATATVLLVNHIANRTRIGEPGVEANDVHLGRSMTAGDLASRPMFRSEEHTSELQSLMRTSYAVFCLKKNRHNSGTEHQTK